VACWTLATRQRRGSAPVTAPGASLRGAPEFRDAGYAGTQEHPLMDIDAFYETRPVTTVMVGIAGAQDGRIVSTSQTFGALLGRRPDALIGRSLVDFIQPDSRERATDQFAHVVNGDLRSFDGVIRFVLANRTVRWLSVHACLSTGPAPPQLLLRLFALPVRLLPVAAANAQRTGATDKLAVAVDLAPIRLDV
jgi:PAS domain-containing protein